MSRKYTELTFTESVKETQEYYGTRAKARKFETWDVDDHRLSEREVHFIAERDSFYMATVGDTGWPYVQFRGGPKGFLTPLDQRHIGYADFRGNLQYISTGNLKHDDRVALFLMDYPNRQRLKIMARARVTDVAEDPELIERLRAPDYKGKIERGVVFEIEAFDWNCPQHITPRYTADEIECLR